jgi:hypothetical protein
MTKPKLSACERAARRLEVYAASAERARVKLGLGTDAEVAWQLIRNAYLAGAAVCREEDAKEER